MSQPPQRQWIIAPPHPQRDRLAADVRVPPLVAQVLLNRGIETADDARAFLSPNIRGLLGPETLPNAVEAGERLHRAVRDGRRIVIYGDYDVDGITASTILWHVLRLADAKVEVYLPNRLDEGYGLNLAALESIAADGPALVISVDCGITAVDEASRARELGIELIITDHHEPGASLPDALVVHPTAVVAESLNPHLSGSGVALKVAWAFAQTASDAQRVGEAFREFLLDATAFAALGLVADVVPLVGENRIITTFGLARLCHTNNVGLTALIDVSNLSDRARYDEFDVGFKLAPRMNAIGRLGHAREAVELFTSADAPRAKEIALQLDGLNRERQQLQKRIADQAEKMVVDRGFHRDSCRAIVLASAEWHPGVVGIVASRLVERFGRPTVLIALSGDQGQGSGRSIEHFPLHEVLEACTETLESHGGHAMAAGLRLRADQVDAFTNAFLAEAANRLTQRDLIPTLRLDDEVDLAQISIDAMDALGRLKPHGPGNRRVRLATTAVELAETPRRVGADGRHVQFTVRQAQTVRKAIAFGFGDRFDELMDLPRMQVAFEPIVSEWKGRRRAELQVLDVRSADET